MSSVRSLVFSNLAGPAGAPCVVRAVGVLALSFSILFGGCGLLGIGEEEGPSDDSEPTPDPPVTDTSSSPPSPTLLSYNDTEIFLSGGNVAWNHFARDVGPAPNHPDLSVFSDMFEQVRENEGNTMRLWLHTNGVHTPAWDDSTVVGPGEGTIEDLRAILDEAQRQNVGMIVCLWSFDMLRTSYGEEVTNRAHALLTQRDHTESYVENALVPMVEALSDHPALVAWEIFNEPAGMSNEFGWSFTRHVPFDDIQRFVNLTAGAIHETDSDALVTSGAWSFSVLTDADLPSSKVKMPTASALAPSQVTAIQQQLSRRPGLPVNREAARSFYRAYRKSAHSPHNYYRDDRLIDAGGHEKGTLDFYSVHYYEWAGTEQSPFHHDATVWGLEKPVVVGEFYLGGSHDSGDNDSDSTYGVAWQDLYSTLYERGYTGALGWQWFDWDRDREGLTENWPRALDNMNTLHDEYPDDVDLTIDPPS